ncbi:MAG TPA: hypothetical protein VGN34_12450 [Ktedonobacteraceae bacterium]
MEATAAGSWVWMVACGGGGGSAGWWCRWMGHDGWEAKGAGDIIYFGASYTRSASWG